MSEGNNPGMFAEEEYCCCCAAGRGCATGGVKLFPSCDTGWDCTEKCKEEDISCMPDMNTSKRDHESYAIARSAYRRRDAEFQGLRLKH